MSNPTDSVKLKPATARITIALLDITGSKVIGQASKTVNVLEIIQNPLTTKAEEMHLVQLLRMAGAGARETVLKQLKKGRR